MISLSPEQEEVIKKMPTLSHDEVQRKYPGYFLGSGTQAAHTLARTLQEENHRLQARVQKLEAELAPYKRLRTEVEALPPSHSELLNKSGKAKVKPPARPKAKT